MGAPVISVFVSADLRTAPAAVGGGDEDVFRSRLVVQRGTLRRSKSVLFCGVSPARAH